MRMDSYLSSKTSRAGDKFTSTVTIPVYVGGKMVIPAGSIVEGRVTQVTPARRQSRSGTIAIEFDTIVFPNGSRAQIRGSLTSADPQERQRIDEESRVSGDVGKRSVVFVGGGGAIGAVIGAAAGGGKGAAIGGAVGAGIGLAGVLLSKGAEAEVRPGTPFGIELSEPLAISESFVSEESPDAGRASEPTLPALPLSSPEMIQRAQQALKEQGYYEGQIDGILGPRTSNALRTYQREHGLAETGKLDPETARSLGLIDSNSENRSQPVNQPSPPSGDAEDQRLALSIQKSAEDLLAHLQRSISASAREPEIELIFALSSFSNAADLYVNLLTSLQDRAGRRAAARELARQAHLTEKVLLASSSRAAQDLKQDWDAVRQNVLSLRGIYNISAKEIEY
jgi:type IV secretion system protein VirB10